MIGPIGEFGIRHNLIPDGTLVNGLPHIAARGTAAQAADYVEGTSPPDSLTAAALCSLRPGNRSLAAADAFACVQDVPFADVHTSSRSFPESP